MQDYYFDGVINIYQKYFKVIELINVVTTRLYYFSSVIDI